MGRGKKEIWGWNYSYILVFFSQFYHFPKGEGGCGNSDVPSASLFHPGKS